MYSANRFRRYKSWLWLGVLICLAFSSRVYAQSHEQIQPIDWQLYSLEPGQAFNPEQPASLNNLQKAAGISLVGGHYLYAGDVSIDQDGLYVIDFKNTSVIDHFALYLYDRHNQLTASATGGIGSKTPNPFFLRHGRMFYLKAGQYKLLADVSSPYYIAQPVPYVEKLADYQQDIKLGNAIVLMGIGIFLAMGIYYGALSFAGWRKTELFYAIFIFSNLLFNAGAHLILSQLFGWHNFYLVSFPIVISNFVYILFVMRLLEIHPVKHKRLYLMGMASLVLLAGFALFGMVAPNWVNEMARYGVWVFLLYGLVAGVGRSIQGYMVARLYLVALMAFIILASMATLPTQLTANSIHVEHYGLAAIAVEAILLALVLTYRVGELHRERMRMLLRLDDSKKLAHTDSLTQIPNRYALEVALTSIEPDASLTYIDMDNLKFYNDHFGHAKGDELLMLFAKLMQQGMDGDGTIYRVGGDEFAVICRQGAEQGLQALIERVIDEMKLAGFESIGVSSGVAFMHEANSTSELKHLADIRMYEDKMQHKMQFDQTELPST